MIEAEWLHGDAEVAVVGLGKSGSAAARLLAREGVSVYASDAGTGDGVRRTALAIADNRIAVDVGGHDLARIARARAVIASPGVPPEAPPLAAARNAGVTIVSEIELGLRAMPSTRVVAITGTNGKTTTTALVGHLLRALAVDAVDAGNIGTPLTEIALGERHPAWIALEMSSFQLHDTPGIAPDVGVVTNLSPDHLDRYSSVEEYYADKALLLRNASERSRWVLNADDPETMRLPSRAGWRELPGKTFTFSLRGPASAWYDRQAGQLVLLDSPILLREELPLLGDHNVANALAAALAVEVAADSVDRRALAEGLRSFRALAHRLEVVGEIAGVTWINDSKATNVSSALVAVAGMTRPTVVLLGGRHKGEPYTALGEPLRRVARAVLAYGEAGPIIARDLEGMVPVERLAGSFEDVMARARALARPGDAVLLSPACSSYDMFNNYEERGAAFRRLAANGR
jgi:UDP-N-acetylmuramoylalanine--D-glutamate ligase